MVPDSANPQSLNRFSYVLGNPLNFIDPTGHKSRKEWEQEFRQEHNGQDPTDQDWWDYQFSLQFESWIASFWVETYDLRTLLWHAEVTIRSGDVKWTIAQAHLVGDAVRTIGERFGGDVRRFIGGVRITLRRRIMPIWEVGTWIKDWDASFAGYEYWGGKIALTPAAGLGEILHEMGHYADEKRCTPETNSGAYKRYLERQGIDVQKRYETFAIDFRKYALGVQMDPIRSAFFAQFLSALPANAGGYVWPTVTPQSQ
jgi:hypothetical protein